MAEDTIYRDGDTEMRILRKILARLDQLAGGGAGVSSAIGTPGQIVVSGATGAVTFSLPTDITGVNRITSETGQVLSLDGNAGVTIAGSLKIGLRAVTAPAWGVNGIIFNVQNSVLYTDSSSSGAVDVITGSSFMAGSFAAVSPTTYADAFNLVIIGSASASTNVSITRGHALGVRSSLSAATPITGALIVATTFGTAATSVGIGGGNINAGGTVTSAGTTSTSTAVLTSTATSGLQIYNTADQVTNYERLEFLFSSNIAQLRTVQGGTGLTRQIRISTNAVQGIDLFANGSGRGVSIFATGNGLANGRAFEIGAGNWSQTSGTNVPVSIAVTYNQASGTAANTDFKIARTETALGSGAQLFAEFLAGAAGTTSIFSFSNTGVFTKPGGTVPLITTSSAITTGAAAQLGTLTNAPTAGNPTKWCAINDNGVTRYIPAW